MGKKKPKKSQWWEAGIQFECQGSGKCCTSHGEYGQVYFSKEDRTRAAKLLKITEAEFRHKYCHKVEGVWALKDPVDGSPDCLFLEDKRCSIYEARPTQCRTWPFWPSVMNAKTWKKSIASFCPGVGKGRIWTAEEIAKNLADETANDQSLINEANQSHN